VPLGLPALRDRTWTGIASDEKSGYEKASQDSMLDQAQDSRIWPPSPGASGVCDAYAHALSTGSGDHTFALHGGLWHMAMVCDDGRNTFRTQSPA